MEYFPIALPLFYYKKRENDIFRFKLMAGRSKKTPCYSLIAGFFKIIYLFYRVGLFEKMLSINGKEPERSCGR